MTSAEASPAIPEPDRLDRLVTLIDAATRDGGWFQPHRLIRIEADPTADDDAFLLGQFGLEEGEHPLDYLLGFVAPESWQALGVVCFGWAAPPQGLDAKRGTVTGRPSEHPARQRARVVTIVDRAGAEHSTTALEDGTVIDEPGQGVVGDALRRCLGAPTEPPAESTAGLFASRWLTAVAQLRGRVTWNDVVSLDPIPQFCEEEPPAISEGIVALGSWFADEMTWQELKERAADGLVPGIHIEPLLAEWMDDGMFARWVLAAELPIPELLDAIRRRGLPFSVQQRIRDTLDHWQLPTKRAAA